MSNSWSGRERRKEQVEPIHRGRWFALSIWITAFTAVVIYSIIATNNNKVDVSQLRHTNCGLIRFLYTARHTRYETAMKETDGKREDDLNAVEGYKALADAFKQSAGRCVIPARLLIPGDK